MLFVVFCGLQVQAEEKNSDFYWKLAGVRWYFLWGLDLLPTGVDITLGYKGFRILPGRDTLLQVTAGGGYESFNLYRYADGSPALPGSQFDKMEFNAWIFKWEPGIRQGFLWNRKLDRNLLEGFLFYRGRYDIYRDGRVIWGTPVAEAQQIVQEHTDYQAALVFVDSEGVWSNSLFTGISLDMMDGNKNHQTKQGFYGELSLEWDPYLPDAAWKTDVDFLRFNGTLKGFYTLFDAAPDREKNLFSVYAGDHFSVDYAAGHNIPMFVMQSFGGTRPRTGLGRTLRGFEEYTYDTRFKMVNNIEIRANLPALRLKSAVPGVVSYFDSGYYSNYFGDPGVLKSGFLCSTGFGVYLNLLGVDYLRIYLHFPLVGERVDGKKMTVDVNLGLHF